MMAYYGELLNAANYTSSLTILKDDGNGTGTYVPDGTSCTQTGKVTNAAHNGLHLSTTTATAPSLTAGEPAKAASATFSPGSYLYGTAYSNLGWVFYVREAPGLSIDPSTIKVVWNGTTYTYATHGSQITDNTNCKVYKITVTDQIFGYMSKTMGSYGSPVLSADIKAVSTAATGSMYLHEVFRGHAYGSETFRYHTYASNAYITTDNFEFTGSTGTAIVGPVTSRVINIQANSDFAVSTSADKGDDNWLVYQGTPATYIDLNLQLDARYKLDVRNNTGKQIVGGFAAIIPIPKKGENTGHADFQTADFAWTLNLMQKIDLSGRAIQYNVEYANSYLQTADATGWKSWESIADKKTIRAVKITTTSNVDPDFTDSFYFPLEVGHTPAEAAALQGEVNIYSARVHANLDSNAAYISSEPVALRLNSGIISGTVKMDNDRSGTDNTGDTGVNNVVVKAYTAGHAGDAAYLEDSTTTIADGSYQLAALGSTAVDLVFENPATTAQPMRFVLPAVGLDGANHTQASVTPSADIVNNPVVVNALLQEPYTVTFNADGGSPAPAAQKVYVNGTATRPGTDPQKDHYTFVDWYDNTGATAWNFGANTITADTTIKAIYDAIPYTVTFDVNTTGGHWTGGSTTNEARTVTRPVTNVNGAPGGMPQNPEKDYADFVEWNTQVDGKGTTFTGATVVTGNTTVYAIFEWHTYAVSYHYNYYASGSSDPADLEREYVDYRQTGIVHGDLTTDPGTGDLRGYVFAGWYKSQVGTNPGNTDKWDFAVDPVTAHTKLYAGWNTYSYAVSFDVNGGDSANPTNVTVASPDATVDEAGGMPANPTRAGHKFLGWFTQRTGGALFTGTTPVTGNITVYAQWVDESAFIVTFDGNGADVQANPQVMTVIRPATTLAALPSAPSRTGYVFNGWNTAQDGTGSAFTVSNVVSSDITVYAQWVPNYYQLAFHLNGGEGTAPQTQSLKYQDKAARVADASRTGYTFAGWNSVQDGSGYTWDFDAHTMPANDMTLYAQWTVSSIPGNPGTVPPTPGPGTTIIITTDDGGGGGGTAITNTPTDNPPNITPGGGTQDGGDDSGNASGEGDGGIGGDTDPSSVRIGDEEAPLYGTEAGVWALINLISCIIGGALAVCILVIALVRRKKRQDGDEDAKYYRNNKQEQEEQKKILRPVWLIVGIVLGVVGIIVFLLTEDMRNQMVLADGWTALMLVLLAAEIVGSVFAFKRNKKNEDDGRDAKGGNYPSAEATG
ncbi:MAG: InlB B-repeat-containing protein [Christensenellaceae bacterium]|jgi:uncharacterized repeat protein (TIGR02543 family)